MYTVRKTPTRRNDRAHARTYYIVLYYLMVQYMVWYTTTSLSLSIYIYIYIYMCSC